MHIELIEMLRCPEEHREEFLVLSTSPGYVSLTPPSASGLLGDGLSCRNSCRRCVNRHDNGRDRGRQRLEFLEGRELPGIKVLDE